MNKELRISVCSRSFSQHPVLRAELLAQFKHVKFNDEGLRLEGDSLVAFLQDCDGAIIALEAIDHAALAQLPNLKFIGKYGVGLDKLDFDALEEAGVKLGWTPGVNAQNVAELTIALALSIIKNIPTSNQWAENGNWKQIKGRQLSSMTYGIIGCGHVGKALAKLLSCFGAKILVHDIVDYSGFYEQYNITSLPLDELLEQSDILSIHIPKNKRNENLLDTSKIDLMKFGAYMVNTARGGLVDEVAIIEALDKNRLSGVAFDVLETEPPVDLSFIQHPKTYVTTHIAGSSEEAILAMGRAAIQGLSDFYPANTFAKYK